MDYQPLAEIGLILLGSIAGSIVIGLLLSGFDRKLTARIQWRVGPPLYQPFIDVIKLMGKETLVPNPSRGSLFLSAPVLGFSAMSVAAVLLVGSLANTERLIGGDIIVVLYLLAVPKILLMLGSSASGSVFAAVGVGRAMNLFMGYELPFLLSIIVSVVHTGGVFRLASISGAQLSHGAVVMSVSGAMSAAIALICSHAMLGLVPFDQAEAETEIMSGLYAEYSGPPLAAILVTRAMLRALLPLLLVVVFLGGIGGELAATGFAVAKYMVIVIIMVLLRNTNPRLRIDQAVVFFWGVLTPLALAAVILAVSGRLIGIGWF